MPLYRAYGTEQYGNRLSQELLNKILKMKPIEDRESARKWLGSADPAEPYSSHIGSSTRINGHSDNNGIFTIFF